jgi:hypothetical protein
MTRITVCLLSFLVARADNGRNAEPPNRAGTTPLIGGMRLELQKVSGATVRLTIFNGSSQIYWVNHRMLWTSSSAPRALRDVEMDIRDSDGKQLFYGCKDYYSSVSAGKGDYAILYPKAFVGVEMTLSDCVNMPPGRYRVIARFLDSNNVSGLVPPHPRFDQPLTSPAVDVVVER